MHAMQTLGTLNCERSSASPLMPNTDTPLMMSRSALYCELGFSLYSSIDTSQYDVTLEWTQGGDC